jgi:septal ring factor EnvC (AmiA/AmiB activator)
MQANYICRIKKAAFAGLILILSPVGLFSAIIDEYKDQMDNKKSELMTIENNIDTYRENIILLDKKEKSQKRKLKTIDKELKNSRSIIEILKKNEDKVSKYIKTLDVKLNIAEYKKDICRKFLEKNLKSYFI